MTKQEILDYISDNLSESMKPDEIMVWLSNALDQLISTIQMGTEGCEDCHCHHHHRRQPECLDICSHCKPLRGISTIDILGK